MKEHILSFFRNRTIIMGQEGKRKIFRRICALFLTVTLLLSAVPQQVSAAYKSDRTYLSLYYALATIPEGKASGRADEFFAYIAGIAMNDAEDNDFYEQLAEAVVAGLKDIRIFVAHEKGMPETDLVLVYCFKNSTWLLKNTTRIKDSIYIDDPKKVPLERMQGLDLNLDQQELVNLLIPGNDGSYECDPERVWEIFMFFYIYIDERKKVIDIFQRGTTDYVPPLPETIDEWPLSIPVSVQVPAELQILEAFFTVDATGNADAVQYEYFDDIPESKRVAGTVDGNNLVTGTVLVWEPGPHVVRVYITVKVKDYKETLNYPIHIDTSDIEVLNTDKDLLDCDFSVSQKNIDDLILLGDGEVARTYKDLANDGVEFVAGELLQLISDPIGGLYDDVVQDLSGNQQNEVLQKVIVEMLYGEPSNTSTVKMLKEYADGFNFAKDSVGLTFGIASDFLEGTIDKYDDIIRHYAEDIDKVYSSARGTVNTEPLNLSIMGPNDFKRILDKFDDHMQSFDHGSETGKLMQARQHFEEVAEIAEKRPQTKNNKMMIEKVGIGVDAALSLISIYLNHQQAAEEVEGLKNNSLDQIENESLYSIATTQLQKLEVLDALMEELDPDTPIYAACKTVRSDIENNFVFLSSPAAREALRKDGEVVVKFGCGTALTISGSALAQGISGVLLTTGLATLTTELTTGGAVGDAIDKHEMVQNIGVLEKAKDIIGSDNLNMGYLETELYYTIARMELDYATEINRLTYGNDNTLSLNMEQDLLNNAFAITMSQRQLLDRQNEIRKEVAEKNGMAIDVYNPYDEDVITEYRKSLYDFHVELDKIPVYQQNSSGGIEQKKTKSGKTTYLPRKADYKIIASDGEYLTISDMTGNEMLIKKDDIPGIDYILEKKNR